MNVIKALKTTLLSILLIGTSVLAGPNCDYSFPNIKLCSNNVCQTDYHICNSYDAQTITQTIKQNHFSNVSDTYYTNINENGEDCDTMSDINVISISNISAAANKNTCNYDNKII